MRRLPAIFIMFILTMGQSCRHYDQSDSMQSDLDELGASQRLRLFAGIDGGNEYKIKCASLLTEDGQKLDYVFGYKLQTAAHKTFGAWQDKAWIIKADRGVVMTELKKIKNFSEADHLAAMEKMCEADSKNMSKPEQLLTDEDRAKSWALIAMLTILNNGQRLPIEYDDYFEQ